VSRQLDITVQRCDQSTLVHARTTWPDAADVLQRLSDSSATARHQLLVAVADGRAVGQAVVRWAPTAPAELAESAAEIAHLFVRSEYRRSGVATALLAHAHGELRARSCRRALLGVDRDNVAAAGLYLALGYQRTGLIERSDYEYVDDRGVIRRAVEWNEWLVKNLAR
jgi:ribosomal protein S18 acetylase RimI-like enzyme